MPPFPGSNPGTPANLTYVRPLTYVSRRSALWASYGLRPLGRVAISPVITRLSLFHNSTFRVLIRKL